MELIRSASPSNVNASASSKGTLVIAAGGTMAMLYFGRHIFIPLALALVLSFLLSPLVAGLQKAHLGRVPSVLAVMLFCFALTVTVGWGVAGQLLEITSHIGDYRINFEEKISSFHEHKSTPLSQATATVEELNKALSSSPAEAAKAAKNKQEGGHPPR